MTAFVPSLYEIIVLIIMAATAITVLVLVIRHEERCPPAPPVDADPALARPISAELRQAITERENGNA